MGGSTPQGPGEYGGGAGRGAISGGGPQQAPSCSPRGTRAGGLPVPRAGLGEAGGTGPHLGSMSNRRTFPSISQPPPQGTIHLHSIFTPLHMFPFQPRIIFYHQITVAIRWSRCDSEQSARPPLSSFPSIPPPSATPSLLALSRRWGLSKCQEVRRDPLAAGFTGWDQTAAGGEGLGAGRQQLPRSSGAHQAVWENLRGALPRHGTPPAAVSRQSRSRASAPLPTAPPQQPGPPTARGAPAR